MNPLVILVTLILWAAVIVMLERDAQQCHSLWSGIAADALGCLWCVAVAVGVCWVVVK